eukprot:767803-Hanusia_phi.AAC.2
MRLKCIAYIGVNVCTLRSDEILMWSQDSDHAGEFGRFVCIASLKRFELSGAGSADSLDAPSPELDQLPMGATRNTWPNIVRNKRNVIFCSTQFQFIDNRERCMCSMMVGRLVEIECYSGIRDFVKGPLLD